MNKDLKRLSLIQEHYPIEEPIPTGKQKTLTFKIPPDGVIGGFAALALTVHDYKLKLPWVYDPKVKVEKDKISLTLPGFTVEGDDPFGKQNLVIYTDHFEKYLPKDRKNVSYYERFLDYRPRTVLLPDIEIADTKGRLVPYQIIEGVKVANYQWILLYLLERYFSTNNKQFLGYYSLVEKMDLDLTVQTYGCCDWSFAFIKSYTELVEYINSTTPRTNFREPFGYYPPNSHPEFTLTGLEIFELQGRETKPFHELELPKVERPAELNRTNF